jgi:hypothetical protein
MWSESKASMLNTSRVSSDKSVQIVASPGYTAGTDNILSGLFASPKAKATGTENVFSGLRSFHREVLGRLLPNILLHSSVEKAVDGPGTQSAPKPLSGGLDKPPKMTINAHQAQKYLDRYESLFAYFPFVVLPSDWTLQSMLKHHPFLVLGILTAMSQGHGHLHLQLDAEFRKVMSEKVTMNGEKSLDILQGLLVHIAWYVLETLLSW